MPKPELRTEDQILVCIARREIDDATAQRLNNSLSQPGLDWDYISTAAGAHGVSALLAHHLLSLQSELVPREVISRLAFENQQNTQRCLVLAGELTKITGALTDDGIPSIAYKGPTLSLTAYGDLGLREFGDLDVLVEELDVDRATRTLQAAGFTPVVELSPGQESAMLRFDNAWAFSNDQDVLIDLHWRFAPAWFDLRFETEELWRRLEIVRIGDREVKTLSSEDLLLVLCCHGYTHEWERLGWICDVASLIERKTNLDWDYLFRAAERLGVLRIVLLGLALAGDLLTDLPNNVASAIAGNDLVKRIADECWKRLFARKESSARELLTRQWNMRERSRDRVTSLFAFALTPRHYDWRFVTLPQSLTFLYYAVRPVRKVVKPGNTFFSGD